MHTILPGVGDAGWSRSALLCFAIERCAAKAHTILMQIETLNKETQSFGTAGRGGEPVEWIDLDLAHDQDVRWLKAQSGLEAGVIKLILERSKATLHEQFGQGTYWSVLMTKLGEDASKDQSVEVAIWVDSHRFITLRRGSRGEVLQGLAKAIEAGVGPDSPQKALAYIVSRFPRLVEQDLARLASSVGELEDSMLDRDQALPIDGLASLRRRLIYMRRYKAPLASMVDTIAKDPQAGNRRRYPA